MANPRFADAPDDLWAKPPERKRLFEDAPDVLDFESMYVRPSKPGYTGAQEWASAATAVGEGVGRGLSFLAYPPAAISSLLPLHRSLPDAPNLSAEGVDALKTIYDSGGDIDDQPNPWLIASMFGTEEGKRPKDSTIESDFKNIEEAVSDPVGAMAHLFRHLMGWPEPDKLTGVPYAVGSIGEKAAEFGAMATGGGVGAIAKGAAVGGASGAIEVAAEAAGAPKWVSTMLGLLPIGYDLWKHLSTAYKQRSVQKALDATSLKAQAAARQVFEELANKAALEGALISEAEATAEAIRKIEQTTSTTQYALVRELEGTIQSNNIYQEVLDLGSNVTVVDPKTGAAVNKVAGQLKPTPESTALGQKTAVQSIASEYAVPHEGPMPTTLYDVPVATSVTNALVQIRNEIAQSFSKRYTNFWKDLKTEFVTLTGAQAADVLDEINAVRDIVSPGTPHGQAEQLFTGAVDEVEEAYQSLLNLLFDDVAALMEAGETPATLSARLRRTPTLDVPLGELNKLARAMDAKMKGAKVGDVQMLWSKPKNTVTKLYTSLLDVAQAEYLNRLNACYYEFKKRFDNHPGVSLIMQRDTLADRKMSAINNGDTALQLSQIASASPELQNALAKVVQQNMYEVLRSSNPGASLLSKQQWLSIYDPKFGNTYQQLVQPTYVTKKQVSAARQELMRLHNQAKDGVTRQYINDTVEKLNTVMKEGVASEAQIAKNTKKIEELSKYKAELLTAAGKAGEAGTILEEYMNVMKQALVDGTPAAVKKGWEIAKKHGKQDVYADAFIQLIQEQTRGNRKALINLLTENAEVLRPMLRDASVETLNYVGLEMPLLLTALDDDLLRRAFTLAKKAPSTSIIADVASAVGDPGILSALSKGVSILTPAVQRRLLEQTAINAAVKLSMTDPRLTRQLLKQIAAGKPEKAVEAVKTLLKESEKARGPHAAMAGISLAY